jgi:ubiquinone/menaquinone biosynthesis C-methylase UbiE
LKECKRVLKQNGTLYLNVINDSEITIRAFELMEIATRDLMYKLHETIIWYRYNQQPANTKRQLTNQCEFVFMLRHSSTGIELDKESAYKNAPEMFKTKNVGNVWELPFNAGKVKNNFGKKETESKWGHGGFPVKLPETCILLSTKENDIVLDLFAGSGTTGVACKNLNRNYILIEKEPEYIDIINKRLNEEEDKLLKAIAFAKEKHRGQLDDNGKDYFEEHCLQVYKILMTITKDENILCAGLLHDTLEDTKTTYNELVETFGNDIADLVMEVTHEGTKHKGYYFPRLKTQRGIMLKFADRLSNLSRMEAWDDKRREHYLKKSKFWKSEI